jgi:ketosteroid isomerase-like protein
MSEWTWTGTNTGSLPRRDGTVAVATGGRVQLCGMEVAQIRDSRIAEYRIYWDGIALANQLG